MRKYLVSYAYTLDFENWHFSRECVTPELGHLSEGEVCGFERRIRAERNARAVCVIAISPLDVPPEGKQ